MKFFPESGLQRQMIFYILFIAIVFFTMAAEMIVFLHGDRVLTVLESGLDSIVSSDTVVLIQLKVGVMLLNLLFSIGLVMLLFTKRIMIPLGHVIASTRAMSDGDFSATAPVQTKDELGELANRINELAANYQELILLCRSMTNQARGELEVSGEDCQLEQAMAVLDDLDETLGEFGRSFYR